MHMPYDEIATKAQVKRVVVSKIGTAFNGNVSRAVEGLLRPLRDEIRLHSNHIPPRSWNIKMFAMQHAVAPAFVKYALALNIDTSEPHIPYYEPKVRRTPLFSLTARLPGCYGMGKRR